MAIAVVGSTNIDMVAYAKVLPESGETVKGEDFILGFGGKGANQAVVTARFGVNVYMVNSIGDDVFGETTLSNFAKENVNTQYVSKVSGPSGVAPIWVDGEGNNRIIVVPGANGKMTSEQVEAALNSIEDLEAVIGQFEIPTQVTAAAFKVAKAKGVLTIFNPAPFEPIPDNLLQNCDWIIPNESEFAGLHPTGKKPIGDSEILELASYLKVNLCVTLGAAGAALVIDGIVHRVAAPIAKAVDTTGAGDCFVGTFTFGLISGLNPIQAAELGTKAASLSVTRLGTMASYPNTTEAQEMLNIVKSGS